jgi:hypothetical protein
MRFEISVIIFKFAYTSCESIFDRQTKWLPQKAHLPEMYIYIYIVI